MRRRTTWSLRALISFRDHQVWPSKARSKQCPSFLLMIDFSSLNSQEEVLQWGVGQGRPWWWVIHLTMEGPQFFCKQTRLWTFKLFRPHLMLYIHEHVSFSSTRMTWRFERMPEFFLIEGSSGVNNMGQREYSITVHRWLSLLVFVAEMMYAYRLARWLTHWLACWLTCWLSCWLTCWLASWLANGATSIATQFIRRIVTIRRIWPCCPTLVHASKR